MRKHAMVFTEESLVRPEFQASSEITNIVKRWESTGILEHTHRYEGQYGSFVGPESYHDACNRVLEADEMFSSLPSSVRDRYGNDVGEFLSAVDAGDEFLREAGILKPDEKSSKRAVRSRSRNEPADASGASEADAASGDNNNNTE